MKKILWFPVAALITAVIFTACFKDDDTVQCTPNTLAQDQHVIDSFIDHTGADLTFNSEYNAYIGALQAGSGSSPAEDSAIAFKYSIKLLDGSTVLNSDSLYKANTGMDLRLEDLKDPDPLLHYVIDNLNVGGTTRVVVPSSYMSYGILSGAGCQQLVTSTGTVIPAYSQLIYDVTLTGVKESN